MSVQQSPFFFRGKCRRFFVVVFSAVFPIASFFFAHTHAPFDCCVVSAPPTDRPTGTTPRIDRFFAVEYQTHPSMTWHPCFYERSVVEHLLKTQFGAFLERVKKTDCQAELRRLLKDGPPIWLSDPHALPLSGSSDDGDDDDDDDEDGEASKSKDDHVCAVWYAGDDLEVSAKLVGAVEGDDRENLWNELRRFLVEEGKEPGDDENDDGEAKTER